MATKRRLSKKAIGILRWVQKQITEEPLRLSICDWGASGDEAAAKYKKLPECNSVGCIAWWIVMHSRKSAPVNWLHVPITAYCILGLDHTPDLFHSEEWPIALYRRIVTTKPQTKVQARVVCEAIDRWIEGDGSFA